MVKTSFFILVFFSSFLYGMQLVAEEDDDFWLLLDYYEPLQNSLWLYGGADELDGNYYGLSADLAIIDSLHFNFSITKQDYSVETTDLRWGFSGTVNRNFSWSILKTFWGKKDNLEKNDVGISLSYFYRAFTTRVSIEGGDVELFLLDSPSIERDSISSRHRAYEIAAGYSWAHLYTQLSFKQHNYEKDLSLLNRPRLLRLINPVGIQQAGALAEKEISLLSGIRFGDMNYEAFISRIKSSVTQESNIYATLRLSKVLTRQLTLGVDVELPVDNAPFSAGLTAGIMW